MIIFFGILSLIVALNLAMMLYTRVSASIKEKASNTALKANSAEILSMNLLSSEFKKAV